VEAIRGTDADGDNSDGSWDEAAPSGNDNVLRFRLAFPASGAPPQPGTSIQWEIAESSQATRSDFLQCLNEACTQTRNYAYRPRGRTPISATEAAKTTGPWHIMLPFTLFDDGHGEAAETFTVQSPASAAHNGANITAFTQQFTIAMSSADTGRLLVGIGNADCSGRSSNCPAIPATQMASGVPAVAAADRLVGLDPGNADLAAQLRADASSSTVVGFPITFYTPDGNDMDSDPDPVSATNIPELAVGTGGITIRYTIGGTIFDNGTPADSGAALSAYQRYGRSIRLSNSQVKASHEAPQRIYVVVPLAQVAGDETLTVTITEVGGNGGAISQHDDTQGVVAIREVGGYFSLSTDGATGVANSVAESAMGHTYTVTYTGLNAIPAGGATLDWAVVATAETPASAADFGTSSGNMAFPMGDDAISFAAGETDGAAKTFTVPIYNDNMDELAETFRVVISDLQVNGGPSAALRIAQASVATTIAASDPHIFTLSCPPTAAEGAMLNCTVTHNGPALAAATQLDWSIGAPSAAYTAAPADFNERAFPRAPGGVQFAAGAADGAVVNMPSIAIHDDIEQEPEERFVVAIRNPQAGSPLAPLANAIVQVSGASGAQVGDGATADVAIPANDVPGVTVSVTDLTVIVGQTATYTVVLDAEPGGDVTITPASDTMTLATVSGALTFTDRAGATPWDTPQTVTVPGVAMGTATISHTVAGGAITPP